MQHRASRFASRSQASTAPGLNDAVASYIKGLKNSGLEEGLDSIRFIKVSFLIRLLVAFQIAAGCWSHSREAQHQEIDLPWIRLGEARCICATSNQQLVGQKNTVAWSTCCIVCSRWVTHRS
ncbi:uncharacterized protein LOC9641522 [Selaginella moellendorffii]|uniref:uncharacterized protein LOC9641522 n=1 Tax=Selaginella moellendorffii TaxID=88036 RepID=UPI000D1CA8A2|nr:uncharacterized protein LOC9641522 [Selaginella moellendorffii]|eukprot:XP_024516410.1 uncharacterized protein LOC9641522 [Selaginella moellendorffii]